MNALRPETCSLSMWVQFPANIMDESPDVIVWKVCETMPKVSMQDEVSII